MKEGKDEGFFRLLEIDQRMYGRTARREKGKNSYYKKMMSDIKRRSKNKI